jgi:hypothetical protein
MSVVAAIAIIYVVLRLRFLIVLVLLAVHGRRPLSQAFSSDSRMAS